MTVVDDVDDDAPLLACENLAFGFFELEEEGKKKLFCADDGDAEINEPGEGTSSRKPAGKLGNALVISVGFATGSLVISRF